jgi:hypothetical protein
MKYNIPGKDAPGYLRREQARLDYLRAVANQEDEIEKLLDWLVQYVTEPKGKEREAIMDASENLIAQMVEDATRPVVPDPKASAKSEAT